MPKFSHLAKSFAFIPPQLAVGDECMPYRGGYKGKRSVLPYPQSREFPKLKQKLRTGEMWEDGYFTRTVGDRMTREIVEKYIEHYMKYNTRACAV